MEKVVVGVEMGMEIGGRDGTLKSLLLEGVESARSMLKKLSGASHYVTSGVAMLSPLDSNFGKYGGDGNGISDGDYVS